MLHMYLSLVNSVYIFVIYFLSIFDKCKLYQLVHKQICHHYDYISEKIKSLKK